MDCLNAKNGITLLLLGWLLISLSIQLTACGTTQPATPSPQDSILPTPKKYQGYRLQLANIQVEKKKGRQYKISCTLINTGREEVKLPIKKSTPYQVVIQYDNSLMQNNLQHYKNSIEQALQNKKFVLDAGKLASNFELKFSVTDEELATKTTNKETPYKQNADYESPIATEIYDKNYCPDLRIDTFFVLKRTKKTVELAFTIANYGKGPAAMFGETESTEDNVAIRAYASGTPKLSRGDLVLGGAFIEDGMNDKNGVLMPNETFSGSFVVETRKKTRYMPYFILSLDAYQSLWECDERNNVKALLDR